MKRILITGSQGYIGSALTPYLEQAGFECIGYDTGFFEPCLLYPAVSTPTVHDDVRNFKESNLDGIGAVVHLAGISNDPMGKLDVSQIYDPTRSYSLAIAKLCKKRRVKFIFASSCSVYGLGGTDLLTEASPTNPQTPYSLNKLQIEGDLQSISDKTFSPIALRFATVFGPSPRIRFDVVINMLTGMAVSNRSLVLNSNGLSWRPHLHILDACEAIRCAIQLEYEGENLLTLNVGSEENNLQILEIAKKIQNNVPGCDLKYLSDDLKLDQEGLIRDKKIKKGEDTRTYKVSFAKIKKIIPKFQCQWRVERGIHDLVDFFNKMPLSPEIFKSRGFYRLQKLEDLYAQGRLSNDLFWLKRAK